MRLMNLVNLLDHIHLLSGKFGLTQLQHHLIFAKDATVLNEKMEMLREGTNGWTCLPVNPRGMSDPENGWKDAHEAMPLCGDAEVFKWISAYLSDEIPDMDYDGYAWMLHGDMGEDNSTPKVMSKDDAKEGHWIESGPHLMRMPKDPSSLDGMTTDFNSGAPYVMFSGTPYAHVMYPIQDYIQTSGTKIVVLKLFYITIINFNIYIKK